MKRLVLALVLGNAGYFVWWYWLAAPMPAPALPQAPGLLLYQEQLAAQDAAAAAQVPADDGRLPAAEDAPAVLAMTEPAGQAPAQESPADHDQSAPGNFVCASLGPFAEPAERDAATTQLRQLGFNPRVREEGGQLRAGYWVYLPSFSSRAAAEQTADNLKSRGVTDLYIVSDEENRNAISLGLFSTPERAAARAAQIQAMDFKPQIRERFREVVSYWLDFQEPATAPLDLGRISLPERHEPLRRISVDCAAG